MFEKNSEAIKSAGPVEIVGPVLGFELKDYPYNTPSSAERIVIFFNLNHVSESLWQQGRIKVEINGLKENKTTRRTFELELKDYPYKKILGITHSIPARDELSSNVTLDLSRHGGHVGFRSATDARWLETRITDFIRHHDFR